MENKYYVYLHIKETTGEPFYVGKGHKNRATRKEGRNDWWFNTVNKYGYDVIFLEINLSEKEALDKEIYWINRIGRKDLNNGPLVNKTDGGETNNNPSQDSRKKISDSKLGNQYTKGFKHSKESIELRASQLRGKPRDEKTRKKLSDIQKTKLGEESPASKKVINLLNGIFYSSAKEAAESINMDYKKFNHLILRDRINFKYV